MRITILFIRYVYAITAFHFLFISCKPNPELEKKTEPELFDVNFNLANFETKIKPLSKLKNDLSVQADQINQSNLNTDLYNNELLFYWNFNEKNDYPSIMNFETGYFSYYPAVKPTFTQGFHGLEYPNDFALEFTGLEELKITFKAKEVYSLDEILFEIGTSNKGPKGVKVQFFTNNTIHKDLEYVYYFEDQVNEYKMHSIAIDLKNVKLTNPDVEILIKLLPPKDKASTSYHQEKGITKIDNIRIYGSKTKKDPNYKILHHLVFDAKDGKLVNRGEFDVKRHKFPLNIKLPFGKYFCAFVYNHADFVPDMPSNLDFAKNFYVSNSISNAASILFGSLDTIEIDKSMQRTVKLKRHYSQIRFIFEDADDLEKINEIIVKKIEGPQLWAPFNPDFDALKIIGTEFPSKNFMSNFKLYRGFSFNQYFGGLEQPQKLKYRLEVLESSLPVRTFEVEVMAKPNSLITFKGNALKKTSGYAGFTVQVDENWGEKKVVNF